MELNVGITVSCFPYVARPLKMSLQRVAGKTNSRKVFSDFSGANNIGSNGSKSRNTTNDSQEEIFDPSASTMGPEGIILKTTSFDVSTSSIKEGQMPSAIDQRFLSDRI
ncbi:MAG: hypothetical protein M1819_004891 [Sarea resinae]|nr:MAG: hypothetical protein M1819_004891 [Sarea resinae]